MKLSDYVRRIAHRWLVIVAVLIVTVGLTAAATSTVTPVFESNTRVFVSNSAEIKDIGTQMAAGVYAQQKVLSYSSIASSALMGAAVKKDLGLAESADDIARKVSTTVEYGTVLVSIRVQDTSAERAKAIAESIINNYNPVLRSIDAKEGTLAPVTVTVMEYPSLATAPTQPNWGLNLLASGFAGLLLGIAAAALRDLMDDSVKSAEALTAADLPVLGSVPRRSGFRKRRKRGADQFEIIGIDERTPTAEAFRQLRLSIQFASVDRTPRTLLVTSTTSGEGKSFTSANLAAVHADMGARVLLVDSDLRRPVLAKRLGLVEHVGLLNVLIGTLELRDAVQPVDGQRFWVLAAGPAPANPADVLATDAIVNLVKKMQEEYDVVIFDSPPVGLFVDARELAPLADGVVVVSRRKVTRMRGLTSTVEKLREVTDHVLGIVVNFDKVQSSSAYDYYSYKRPVKVERRNRLTEVS